jgi:hypothetical protein
VTGEIPPIAVTVTSTIPAPGAAIAVIWTSK